MKNKKVIPILLQLPLILVMIISFFGSIYAAIYKISGIGFATPVIIGIIIVLYFYGRCLERKRRNDFF
jgi:hypothetical protein